MAKQKRVQVIVQLRNVRMSFAQNLFEPGSQNEGEKPAYSAHFLMGLDHPALKELRKALTEVAKQKFGKAAKKTYMALKRSDKLCLRDGNTKTDSEGEILEGYEDNFYVSARSYVKPTTIDRDRSPLSEADGKLYSGCYVNAILAIWAQTGQFGKRINAQLQGVQFVSAGESFGGGKAADPDQFDTLEDEFGDDDEAEDLDADDLDDDYDDDYDDDIPF